MDKVKLGGKRNLAKRITALLDITPHKTYAEPFVGMGGIFLRRSMRPRAEVINDYGRDVSNLFRILQRHYPQFLEVLRFQLTTRVEFERLVDTDPDTLTDLERAARFLYLQRTAFGGKVSGRNFGVSKDRPGRFNLTTLEPMLEDLHTRLSGVVIECLDYAEFITRYDGPETLFYLDPPYFGNEGDYGKDMFERKDFVGMADQLGSIKGRFLMSINDVPQIRELFAEFHQTAVETTYTIGKQESSRGSRGELLISNFGLKQRSVK
ncbi:DNA adenine methylase [uncultured Pelagimonas sp.]|uniref:DNA adenine methylase n=1 Tax=uncultured Pelagimonas sp. TaxID=1618102 RepID=UPI00262EF02A|nr:DNA adenine methylase [uncultured Pelagimonas sp.]